MAEKVDLLAIFGPADRQDEDAIKNYAEHLAKKQEEAENDFDLEDIHEDEVDEEELERFFAEKDKAKKEEAKAKDRAARTSVDAPKAFQDDFSGRPSWEHQELYQRNAKGKQLKFAPLAICDWLYQMRALSTSEDELYFLAHDFCDPQCDGLYRHGDDALASLLREDLWPNAPEQSIREVILTAHRYVKTHRRTFVPNQNAYVCHNDVDNRQYTVLLMDEESGEVTVHDGYVDPALQVTAEYDLGVVWQDFGGELTDEQRAAVTLVDHLVDGVTGDDPRLALRLLQAAANTISINKHRVGIPVNLSYDLPGIKNGGNGKSEFWHTVRNTFASVMTEAPLRSMRDNTGLSRLVGKLAWYVDESTPAISEQDATTLKSLSLGATESANMKYEKYASQVFGTFILSSNFSISFGAKFNGEQMARRLHVLPFLADVEHGPHAIPRIKDRILSSPTARSYLLWLLVQARRVFVRRGYQYEPVPTELGDLDKQMLADTSPVELWLREAGEDVLTGYRPTWRVPHLVETSTGRGVQRWMVFPLHLAKQAKEYRARLLEQRAGAAVPYVVDASGAEERGRVLSDVKFVFANDKQFLFAAFSSWCAASGMQAPGATTWARLLSQRTGTVVLAADHTSTPLGTRTLLLEPGTGTKTIKFWDAVSRAEAARDGDDVTTETTDEPRALTADDFSKIQKIALAVRDFGGVKTDDGDAVVVSAWAAEALAWSVLEAYGVIPRGTKLHLSEPEQRDVGGELDPERAEFLKALLV